MGVTVSQCATIPTLMRIDAPTELMSTLGSLDAHSRVASVIMRSVG